MAFLHVALKTALKSFLAVLDIDSSLKPFNNEQDHVTFVGIGYTLFQELDFKERMKICTWKLNKTYLRLGQLPQLESEVLRAREAIAGKLGNLTNNFNRI